MDALRPPLTIGVAGGTGSGKSTFCGLIAEALPELDVSVIGTDGYYKQTLPRMVSPVSGAEYEDWNSPESFDAGRLIADIAARRRPAPGRRLLLVEGICVLYFKEIRDVLDLSVFVDLDADERMFRRLKRNMTWNLQFDDIAQYYLESAKHSEMRHFLPSRVYADVAVNGNRLNGPALQLIAAWVKQRI